MPLTVRLSHITPAGWSVTDYGAVLAYNTPINLDLMPASISAVRSPLNVASRSQCSSDEPDELRAFSTSWTADFGYLLAESCLDMRRLRALSSLPRSAKASSAFS